MVDYMPTLAFCFDDYMIVFGKEDEEKDLEVICSIQTLFSLSEITLKCITLFYF